MIVLTNPDLPDSAVPSGKGGVGFRIYKGSSRQLAPILRFNSRVKSQYQYAPTEGVDIPLIEPNYGGLFFQLPIGFTISSLLQVSTASAGFKVLSNPLTASLGTVWTDNTRLSIYTDPSTTVDAGDTLALVFELNLPLAEATENTVEAELPSGVIATQVTVSGLTFTTASNPSVPVAGEFVQTGSTLIIYTGTGYQLPLGSRGLIKAITTLILPEPIGVALSFDLSQYNVDTLDAVEYLGSTYVESLTPAFPSLNQYFWNNSILTLFVSSAVGKRLIRQPQTLSGTTSGGTTSYVQQTEVG